MASGLIDPELKNGRALYGYLRSYENLKEWRGKRSHKNSRLLPLQAQNYAVIALTDNLHVKIGCREMYMVTSPDRFQIS